MNPKNAEFIAMFKVSGWSARDAAKKLRTTTASISRYLNDKLKPTDARLELFRRALLDEKPGALQAAVEKGAEALAEWEREIIEDLRGLEVEDRKRVIKALRALIEGLPRRHANCAGSAGTAAGHEIVKRVVADTLHKRAVEQSSSPTPRSQHRSHSA